MEVHTERGREGQGGVVKLKGESLKGGAAYLERRKENKKSTGRRDREKGRDDL